MFEIIDIDSWPVVERWPAKGSRNKIWVSDTLPDVSGFFLFKESHKNYPWEFWTEIIAYQLGQLTGISVPRTRCAHLRGIYGAIVDYIPKVDFVKENRQVTAVVIEQMFDGGEWVLKLDPTFDRKEGTRHNICQIEQILSKSEFRQFVRMLIFDALVGNTDRHQDNWALLVQSNADSRPPMIMLPHWELI